MKISKKNQKKLNKITEDISVEHHKFAIRAMMLRSFYKIQDPNKIIHSLEDLSENEWEYSAAMSYLTATRDMATNKLYAKYIALLLVACHIARRGHSITTTKINKKLDKVSINHANIIREQINNLNQPIEHTYLYKELKKYGITYHNDLHR